MYRARNVSFVGWAIRAAMVCITFNKAFIGVDAVDLNTGFMNFSANEIAAKELMIKASRAVTIVSDHSKLHRVAFVNICRFELSIC